MNSLPNRLPRPGRERRALETPLVWHQLAVAETLAQLRTDSRLGLSSAEAALRLQKYGPNTLPPPPKRSPWLRFLLQFHNVLIYVMLVAAAITGLLQHWVDTGVLLAAVVVNAVIGYIQEGKAEVALDAVRNILSPRSMVIRNDERTDIPAQESASSRSSWPRLAYRSGCCRRKGKTLLSRQRYFRSLPTRWCSPPCGPLTHGFAPGPASRSISSGVVIHLPNCR